MNRPVNDSIVDLRRRYLALNAMRWLPNGLLVTVFTLLWIDRDFTLSEIGSVFAAQALTVFLLELPTGGLADALGRRPVLIAATILDACALALVVVANTVAVFIVLSLLMGVYRALESGPLDAWLVDALHDIDPHADVEIALGAGAVSTALAIACGSLIGSGLVAIGPVAGFDALVLPIVVALFIRLLDVAAIAMLMTEQRPRADGSSLLLPSIRQVPTVVRNTVAAIKSSHVLTALIAVELFWGFGMVTFETLAPVRLAAVVDGTEQAASLFGPASTAAWLVSAAGAWAAPRLARRVGTAAGAMLFHGIQAATIVGMALAAGPIGVIGFFLLTLGCHGGANPLYKTLLNAQATSSNRTTVMSAASMAAFPGFAIGGILLGAIADARSLTVAMIVGAGVLMCVLPLYLPAWRHGASAASRTGPSRLLLVPRHNGPMFTPPPQITCIDCGGRCFLLTQPREDGSWEAGDAVAYRCEDCMDRWDLVLEDDDIERDGRPDW